MGMYTDFMDSTASGEASPPAPEPIAKIFASVPNFTVISGAAGAAFAAGQYVQLRRAAIEAGRDIKKDDTGFLAAVSQEQSISLAVVDFRNTLRRYGLDSYSNSIVGAANEYVTDLGIKGRQ